MFLLESSRRLQSGLKESQSGGVKAGVILGLIVAVLSPVIGSLDEYYGVTYLPATLEVAGAVFQLIAHAVEGAVASLIYGSRVWVSAPSPA